MRLSYWSHMPPGGRRPTVRLPLAQSTIRMLNLSRLTGSTAPRSLSEHVEIVFGLDKPMIDFLGRVLTTTAIGRHAAMRKAGISSARLARYSDQEVEDKWETYRSDCAKLLKETEEIGLETKSRPYPARVSVFLVWTFVRGLTSDVLPWSLDRSGKDFMEELRNDLALCRRAEHQIKRLQSLPGRQSHFRDSHRSSRPRDGHTVSCSVSLGLMLSAGSDLMDMSRQQPLSAFLLRRIHGERRR